MQQQRQLEPILMVFNDFQLAFLPYCKGKKHLEDYLMDMWQNATPMPDKNPKGVVKMITPQNMLEFTRMCLKENG